MKKIPTLFERDFKTKPPTIKREPNPDSIWVLDGEGEAFIKRDGTSCAVIGGNLYKRYDVKTGKKAPEDGIPCCPPDSVTGHWPHWVPVTNEPQNKYHLLAFTNDMPDGTYELCGPHIQGNPEGYDAEVLIPHNSERVLNVPRDFDGLAEFLKNLPHEGIVFHHEDGRMCKVRRSDFGYKWPYLKGIKK